MFSTFFAVYLKKYLKSKVLLTLLLLLPLVTIFIAYNFNGDDIQNNIKAGIVFEGDGQIAESISKSLLDSENFTFILYENPETLHEAVISSDISVGYIFDEHFDEKILSLNFDRIVELLYLESDFYAKFVAQEVVKIIYEEIVPYIVDTQLKNNNITKDFDEILSSVDFFKHEDRAFKVDVVLIDGNTPEQSVLALTFIKGTICLFVVTFSFISVISTSRNKHKIMHFSPYLKETKFKFYSILPIFFLSVVSSAISLIIAKTMNVSLNLLAEIIAIILLEISLLLLAILVSSFIKKDLLILLLPFCIIFIIVTHPIFIDIITFFPKLEPFLNILPTFLYLSY